MVKNLKIPARLEYVATRNMKIQLRFICAWFLVGWTEWSAFVQWGLVHQAKQIINGVMMFVIKN